MIKKDLLINIDSGVHTRIAAMIVLKSSELKSKYNTNMYIKKKGSNSQPLSISMLSLISLKILKGEIIELSCNEDTTKAYNAINELYDFINNDLNINHNMSKLDAIIDENTIANEQIIHNIPIGIIVIDKNSRIIRVNNYTLNLLNDSEKNIYGQYIKDVVPTSDLPLILKTKEHQIGRIQHINENIVITNRAPIINQNNEVLGAIGIFQDISEVIGIQEVNEKFKGIISISKSIDEVKELMSKLEKSEEELNYYKDEIRRQSSLNGSFKDIIGNSGSLREVLYMTEKASNSTSTVLIRGESGTGKELIAKAIHYNSNRKNYPLVRVNCAAIPENLLESELFGYEKGSFTGAFKSKPGKFNLAHKGTIFLDEIGDLPITMQVKLLRVLQDMEFESIGGLKTQKVDVRVIAATNRDLEAMMKNGDFREDLYYRLNVINITLPPLKERKEDISLLVEHFIQKLNTKLNKNIKGITNDCIIYLEKYHWPGNIRELENIIERAINMCDGNLITLKDLPFHIRSIDNKEENLINLVNGELLPIEEYEKEIIKIAMQKYKSFNKAGKALGITHRTVSLKCQKYGIK